MAEARWNQMRLLIDRNQKKILQLINGKQVAAFSAKQAREVAGQMMYQAGLLEHLESPDSIIKDQAILMRSGINIGLSDNKDIRKEAQKEAEGNRDLRRYIDGSKGLSERETMGVPKIKLGPPPKESTTKGDEDG